MRECLKKELKYRTSRSSGPGGQHVNKTETRVELVWDLESSECLNRVRKRRVRKRLGSRLTEGGLLILAGEKYRSQHRNREEVTERFLEMIAESIVPIKKRKPTKPTRASQEKRIRNKKIRGELKRLRRNRPG
ncbi:MAG: alternative ribosome rescue aminoacyl-tRNA hydrolase ArfB [Bacteroidales bacterium]